MFVSFVVSMVATMALIPLLMRVSTHLGMLDQPEPRKVHDTPIPRVGGLAILVGMLLPLIALQTLPRPIVGILVGVLIVVTEGVWDDRHPLDYRSKFTAQFVAAIAVVLIGGIEIQRIVLFSEWLLPQWISFPLTVFVLVALTNAINLADGLDGLAGGIAFLCCAALGVLAYGTGNMPAVFLAVALCGALIGFLRFNTHPATVFMGDGGSQLLGLSTASLAVFVTQNENSIISATTPLFLLAVPIIDTIYVTLARVRLGRSPFVADRNHLHHRLLRMGFRHGESVALIYCGQAVMLGAAFLLRYESDLLNLVLFTIIGVLMMLSLLHPRAPALIISVLRSAEGDASRPWITSAGLGQIAAWGLYLTLIAYAALATTVLEPTSDIAVLLGLLFVCVAVSHMLPRASASVASIASLSAKGSAYVLAVVLAWLFADSGAFTPLVHRFEMLVVLAIAVATAASLRFGEHGTFKLNTLDVLVLIMAIVVPNLPGTFWGDTNMPAFAARVVVLFYALEFMLRDGRELARGNTIVMLVTLGALAVKGLL
jgi:UDP-GlcNAc:undecaprenyl-phosphate GlcNAc-1-phosphate transferase